MAQRTDIRQFQAQLAEALLAAQQGRSEEAARWLAVLAGPHRALLPVVETAGVIHEFALHPVPFAPAPYRGLSNVRGELFDVVDLAVLLNATSTPLNTTARLVLVSSTIAARLALLVHQVLGLRRVTELQPATAPNGEASSEWLDQSGHRWQEVTGHRLLQLVVRSFSPTSPFSGAAS